MCFILSDVGSEYSWYQVWCKLAARGTASKKLKAARLGVVLLSCLTRVQREHCAPRA